MLVASRRASDYSLRNQLASLFPALTMPGANTNHALRARLCGTSGERWVHSPPSSIGGVVPTGPAKMAPSLAATNNRGA